MIPTTVVPSAKNQPTESTCETLIRVTERLLRRDGLVRISTRKIASEANVAGGALYHHFKDKAELVHAAVEQGIGDFREVMANLSLMVGQRTVRKNLEHTLLTVLEFHFRLVPIVCSLYADHILLARIRKSLSKGGGPECLVNDLASYLKAEQQLGRVNGAIDAKIAAEMLVAVSLHKAMLDHFLSREFTAENTKLQIGDMVQALLNGIEPKPS